MSCHGQGSSGGGGGNAQALTAQPQAQTITSQPVNLVVDGEKAQITSEQLDSLLALGAQRWQKYGKDRLYLRNAIDGIFGIKAEFYGSGNVSNVTQNGGHMSNNQYKKLHFALNDAYIDMQTGGIGGILGGTYSDELVDIINQKYRIVKGT